jgi:hypothetical protein
MALRHDKLDMVEHARNARWRRILIEIQGHFTIGR